MGAGGCGVVVGFGVCGRFNRGQRAAPTGMDAACVASDLCHGLAGLNASFCPRSVYAIRSGRLAAMWLGLVVTVGGAGPHPTYMSVAVVIGTTLWPQ